MRILIIGDSCTDKFIYGKCDRLCPDAPVPIFIPKKVKKIGGMAQNVYNNLHSLGVNVDLITNVKKITKTRYIDEYSNQIIVRIDSEKTPIPRIVGIENIEFNLYDAIIISDYNKGFLNNEDIKYICNNHDFVFIDTKKTIDDNFINCKFIKINEFEYKNNILNSNILETKLKDKLIVTLGSRGSKYQDKIFPVERVEIKDMVGAGDTFISTFTYKFILTNNISESIRFANECSTIVVQQKGVASIGDFIKV